jgi:hypothetical protein
VHGGGSWDLIKKILLAKPKMEEVISKLLNYQAIE